MRGESTQFAIRNFFERRLSCPYAKLPSLGKLTREGGVLRRHQALIPLTPAKEIHWTGPQSHLISGEATCRYHGIQSPLRLRENLPAREPVVLKRTLMNSARKTITTF